MDAITHAPRQTHPAYHHEGARIQQAIRYIVVHVGENKSAASIARYFTMPESGGSANLAVGPSAAYRCLNDFVIPWGAPPLNTHGLHIEHAGYASWSRARWLLPWNRRTLKRGAYHAAKWCRAYKIPPRVLDAKALLADFGPITSGERIPTHPGPLEGGVVEHRVINSVYHESDHTCPGVNFPLDVWMGYLKKYLADKSL